MERHRPHTGPWLRLALATFHSDSNSVTHAPSTGSKGMPSMSPAGPFESMLRLRRSIHWVDVLEAPDVSASTGFAQSGLGLALVWSMQLLSSIHFKGNLMSLELWASPFNLRAKIPAATSASARAKSPCPIPPHRTQHLECTQRSAHRTPSPPLVHPMTPLSHH